MYCTINQEQLSQMVKLSIILGSVKDTFLKRVRLPYCRFFVIHDLIFIRSMNSLVILALIYSVLNFKPISSTLVNVWLFWNDCVQKKISKKLGNGYLSAKIIQEFKLPTSTFNGFDNVRSYTVLSKVDGKFSEKENQH